MISGQNQTPPPNQTPNTGNKPAQNEIEVVSEAKKLYLEDKKKNKNRYGKFIRHLFEYKEVNEENENPILFQVWDFNPGQEELYLKTWPHYFTEHSIYVIVVDYNKDFESMNIGFWLNEIKQKAPNCPVFICGTHTDDPNFTQEKLSNIYNQIYETYGDDYDMMQTPFHAANPTKRNDEGENFFFFFYISFKFLSI